MKNDVGEEVGALSTLLLPVHLVSYSPLPFSPFLLPFSQVPSVQSILCPSGTAQMHSCQGIQLAPKQRLCHRADYSRVQGRTRI